MPQTRSEKQIQAEISQVKLSQALHGSNPEISRRCEARLLELRKELRALDDTPVMPYRPASSPPSAPRGRPKPPPIPRAPKKP